MKKLSKILALSLSAVMLSAVLFGCSVSEDTATPDTAATEATIEKIKSDIDIDMNDIEGSIDLDTAYEIVLSGDTATVEGGAEADSGSVKITSGGVYHITGTLTDGKIKVNTDSDDETVVLVLDGVSITNSTGPAIHIKNALSCYIVALTGTENTLTDTAGYEFAADDTDGEPDATIFSKTDLVIGGAGTINISANYDTAVKGKDTVVITDATLNITSVGAGIKGRDSLSILGGNITVKAENDGIKTTNDTDDTLGDLLISGGTLTVTSGDDGIRSERNITISGGTVTVSSADDAIHSTDTVSISGGTLALSAGDDGIHADSTLNITDGELTVTESYEGLEATVINISGGDIRVRASDDGINAGGGNDSSQEGGFGGGDPFDMDADAMITISGGTVYLNADGDGFDSNGYAQMSGGTLCIDGPTNSGNGALDFGGDFTVTGGTLIAAGSSGMAECPASSSTQGVIQVELGSQSAGSELVVKDSSGNTVISYTPSKTYSNVVISTADIKVGETYTVYVGGSEAATITTTDTVTSQGGNTMGGGMGDMQQGGMQPGGFSDQGGMQPGGMGGMRGGF